MSVCENDGVEYITFKRGYVWSEFKMKNENYLSLALFDKPVNKCFFNNFQRTYYFSSLFLIK